MVETNGRKGENKAKRVITESIQEVTFIQKYCQIYFLFLFESERKYSFFLLYFPHLQAWNKDCGFKQKQKAAHKCIGFHKFNFFPEQIVKIEQNKVNPDFKMGGNLDFFSSGKHPSQN